MFCSESSVLWLIVKLPWGVNIAAYTETANCIQLAVVLLYYNLFLKFFFVKKSFNFNDFASVGSKTVNIFRKIFENDKIIIFFIFFFSNPLISTREPTIHRTTSRAKWRA